MPTNMIDCPACSGSGLADEDNICTLCQGMGEVEDSVDQDFLDDALEALCDDMFEGFDNDNDRTTPGGVKFKYIVPRALQLTADKGKPVFYYDEEGNLINTVYPDLPHHLHKERLVAYYSDLSKTLSEYDLEEDERSLINTAQDIICQALGLGTMIVNGEEKDAYRDGIDVNPGLSTWNTRQNLGEVEYGAVDMVGDTEDFGSDNLGSFSHYENEAEEMEKLFSQSSGLINYDEDGNVAGYAPNWDHRNRLAEIRDGIRNALLAEVARAGNINRLAKISQYAGALSAQSQAGENLTKGGLTDKLNNNVEFTVLVAPSGTARLYARTQGDQEGIDAWNNQVYTPVHRFLLVRKCESKEQAEQLGRNLFAKARPKAVYGELAKLVGEDNLTVGLDFRRFAIVRLSAAEKAYRLTMKDGWPSVADRFGPLLFVHGDEEAKKKAYKRAKSLTGWFRKHIDTRLGVLAIEAYPKVEDEKSEDVMDRCGRVGEFIADHVEAEEEEVYEPPTVRWEPSEEVAKTLGQKPPFIPYWVINQAHEEWLSLSQHEAKSLISRAA